MNTLSSLSVLILEAVYDGDLAGITEYWKRFSNDALVHIDRGYRLVGLDCHYHYGEVAEYPREQNSAPTVTCMEQLIAATTKGPLSPTTV
ncbi:hypothetical protein F442_19963 [Phytophthora nicotianae P10297]|uniref:Uncharacterized protein n=4 Tax=Phytophthora nicotianae TaxID=4792 RepID=V9E2I8_PHYNI|nr:hypothetical protein F443_20135 [Phytophthora nicotianae P1569]ETL80150.1 hypothetical protein L917_19332 [Phytophthora nicotianae]ETM33399.1 hypothetical protein L914_19365 [Phytophthora nicotianae]ETP31141.1 hypothetical protein F442_19963 [Phytophthora nicotianae P10297]